MVMSLWPRFFGPPCIYRPGVRPSVFPVYRPLQQLAAGLLLGAPRANLLKRNIVIKEICSFGCHLSVKKISSYSSNKVAAKKNILL